MTKFKFRLATLLKLREARRDQARIALAEAFLAEQVLAEQMADIAQQQAALLALQRAAAAEKYLNIGRLLEAQRHELLLEGSEQQLTRQQSLLLVETERRRLALVEADRDVKSLELLKDRQHNEHSKEERRRETKELDEAAIVRQSRSETAVAT